LDEKDPLRTLFAKLDTPNFEAGMKALEDAALVESAYGNEKHAAELKADSSKLGKALVDAIRATHPEFQKDLAPVIPACIDFLSNFTKVFTLNYDLLLYWVIAGSKNFGDGFGLAKRESGFMRPFTKDRRCNVFNLHGALHLFRTAENEAEKRVEEGGGILDAIDKTIIETGRFPLYVAEGTSAAKVVQIRGNAYLRTCYAELAALGDVLFVYGNSASEQDDHIYDAIFRSKIGQVFYCFHKPTGDLQLADARLSHAQKRNGSSIDYAFVDAESVGVWG
jgi:hypothetical protein